MTTNKKKFIEEFSKILSSEGDMFFSSGDVQQDYDHIVDTIKLQGYWSGNRVRYMFNENLEFEGVQERKFGG